MSWIKLREDLHDDPAVVTIADRCGVSVWHAVGVVARVWAWAGRLSADGRVPHAKPSMIDTITHTPGLAEAMQSVGWLLVGDSELRFPKWDRHNGEAAKARAMDAERKRMERSGRSNSPRPESVQKEPDTCPEKSGQFSDQRRGEEKREENTELRSVARGAEPGSGSTPGLPGIDIQPPKGKPEPTQNQIDGFVARGVWLRCWQRQFGRPYTDLRGRKSGSVRTAFVRLGRNEAELERLVSAFLAAPPFKCRENPDPIAFLDSLSAIAAGLNGKDSSNGSPKPGKRPDGTRPGEYPEPIVMPRRA